MNIKMYTLLICVTLMGMRSYAQKTNQTIRWKGQAFELRNVTGSLSQVNGVEALRVERDLDALPFDMKKLGSTVDEPTYLKLKDLDFTNGIIEVKMLSQLQTPSPFPGAQGFIGIAFRIAGADSAFEAIYLRPGVGRSESQFARNKTVQYFSYPNFKFDKLREEKEGAYETAAAVALNEWITVRIEVEGEKAELFIDNSKYSTFIISQMKGRQTRGAIGLWVDIGTVGYFRDLKITAK